MENRLSYKCDGELWILHAVLGTLLAAAYSESAAFPRSCPWARVLSCCPPCSPLCTVAREGRAAGGGWTRCLKKSGGGVLGSGLQHLTTFVAQCTGKQLGMLEACCGRGTRGSLLLPPGSCPAQCCLTLLWGTRKVRVVLKGGARAPGCVFCFI